MLRLTPKGGIKALKRLGIIRARYSELKPNATPTSAAPQTPYLNVEKEASTTTTQQSTANTASTIQTVSFPKPSEITNNQDIAAVHTQAVNDFGEIPGPQSLKLIARFWGMVPLLSSEFTGGTLFQIMNLGKVFGNLLSWGGNAQFFQKFFNVYGPVVRLHGPFGGDVVLLSRPEHASLVFQNEGKQPVRACLDSVEKYRLQHRRLKQAGPFLMTGEDWEKVVNTLTKPLSDSPAQHFKTVDSVCNQFVDRIRTIRNLQDEMPKSFKNELLKYSLECTLAAALNRKFGFLDPTGLSSTSDPGRILDSVNGATEAIRKCEYGFHVWKFVETPAYRSLVSNCDALDSILSKYVERAQSTLKEKGAEKLSDFSLIENLLLKDDILIEDIMTVMLDMLLIGANATAHSIAFMLYHLSKTPKCQKKLFDELMKHKGEITVETLKNMTYLQACIKESMRLSPPIPILNRVLAKDTIIHRYLIPKGTYILMAVHLASLREEYFEDARKFVPERWLSDDTNPLGKELQQFACMPFGHGPKGCHAQDVAKTQIGLLITKILKHFTVEYSYGEIESNNALLASPAKDLNFRFVDRI